jgi:hypothetical protein
MMRPAAQRHIDAMNIVIARRCTMQEALAEVDARNARLKWQASMAALEKVQSGGRSTPAPAHTQRPRQWWERD